MSALGSFLEGVRIIDRSDYNPSLFESLMLAEIGNLHLKQPDDVERCLAFVRDCYDQET